MALSGGTAAIAPPLLASGSGATASPATIDAPHVAAAVTIIDAHKSASGAVVSLQERRLSPFMRQYIVQRKRPSGGGAPLGELALDTLLFAVGVTTLLASRYARDSVEGLQSSRPSPAASLVALALLAASIWRVVRRYVLWTVEAEMVTAIQGVGLQFSQRWVRPTGLFRMLQNHPLEHQEVFTRFIDVGAVHAMVIHEGYFRHRVAHFLGVVVSDAPTVAVVFDDTLPKLAVLRPVLRGLRAVLYQEPELGKSLADLAAEGVPPSRCAESTSRGSGGGGGSGELGSQTLPASQETPTSTGALGFPLQPVANAAASNTG